MITYRSSTCTQQLAHVAEPRVVADQIAPPLRDVGDRCRRRESPAAADSSSRSSRSPDIAVRAVGLKPDDAERRVARSRRPRPGGPNTPRGWFAAAAGARARRPAAVTWPRSIRIVLFLPAGNPRSGDTTTHRPDRSCASSDRPRGWILRALSNRDVDAAVGRVDPPGRHQPQPRIAWNLASEIDLDEMIRGDALILAEGERAEVTAVPLR